MIGGKISIKEIYERADKARKGMHFQKCKMTKDDASCKQNKTKLICIQDGKFNQVAYEYCKICGDLMANPMCTEQSIANWER